MVSAFCCVPLSCSTAFSYFRIIIWSQLYNVFPHNVQHQSKQLAPVKKNTRPQCNRRYWHLIKAASAVKRIIGGNVSVIDCCCTGWEKELEFSALFTLGYRSVGLESALLTYGNKRFPHRTFFTHKLRATVCLLMYMSVNYDCICTLYCQIAIRQIFKINLILKRWHQLTSSSFLQEY